VTDVAALPTTFRVNGREVSVERSPMRRLSEVLRDDLGLTGTKVGCDAGDCGACTVRLDGDAVCACMVPLGQVGGRDVATVEGLAGNGTDHGADDLAGLAPIQAAFVGHGGAQCGICTPGMLMAADALLASNAHPTEQETFDAMGGVLCRCTGYRKIVEAVLDVAGARAVDGTGDRQLDGAVGVVGSRIGRVDGVSQVTGGSTFGADRAPDDVLHLRAVRSPHAHARFTHHVALH